MLSTTAMKSSLDEIIPKFEGATGNRVILNYTPSAQITLRIADGDPNDVVIATAESLAKLITMGKVIAGSDIPLARSQIGMAVKMGNPRPDISSVENFREAILRAKSIATSNPVNGGQSGKYLVEIFEALGISEAVKTKVLYGPGGPAGLIGFFLVRGEAEIGLQQMVELLAVPGIDVVGPLPAAIQRETVFSAGIPTSAAVNDAGKDFVQFLRSATAIDVMAAKGFSV